MLQLVQLDLYDVKKDDVECHIFMQDEAISKSKEIVGVDVEELQGVLSAVANLVKAKIAKYNSTIGVARWGDVVEHFMHNLNSLPNFEYVKEYGQPRIYNREKNIQFIVMTANSGLGNVDELLKPKSEKGGMTQKCIDNNPLDYLDKTALRTFILYIPSLGNEQYRSKNSLSIPIEIAYPIGYSVRETKDGKIKVIPNKYGCRIIHFIDTEALSQSMKFKDKPDFTPTEEITEDSFELNLKFIG